jgi:multiple sugar transport system ATP-binding protein
MNFLEGTLISDTGPEFRSRDDILRVALPDGWSQPSGATILGIRPENLHAPEIRPAGVPLAEASFIVETVEPLGNEIFIHAQAGGQRVTARVPPQTLPTPGEPISFAFDLSKIHLFDPQTDRSVPLH